ncbi:2-oxo-4-hydroxy-4-carboxy-5-ureidoimidazoline decarboxylase [Sphingomonas sp. SORGH_AS_0879]|uniref:2-oxo-4-hydroxy-4-carboxy-5-ureidoimidazoline decarboxylase n=1 Tax=Sphingomonas sp. SORGH_AS_0879 TaxID=3041790 RepID=UPI00277EE5C5|nr:2-oxo-4-hydroxy-4-carboxy-5-ureidoimidazoline decarboxylase [Sphingomonas sp. SORGH_AS_0879]MDQ1229003.1 2-oxo-4-hydroxy-4-carboxy-5-ureidoimidazoline decarboxylase [Sphingomonas sp. SORGH_AS_0879]
MSDFNSLSDAAFVARYGSVVEHSPWVVERAAVRRPFADVGEAIMAVLDAATPEERLSVIRAHPELAGRAAIAGTLTAESQSEQASAGLDRMTPEEFEHFHALNAAYRERFGFPFVICVRRTDRAGILRAMAERLEHDRETEIATALAEIGHIVRLRLETLS